MRVTGGTEGKDYLFDADTATLTVLQGDLTVAGTGSAREKGSIVVFRDYTGTQGNALIYAGTIGDRSQEAEWSGLFVYGDRAAVYGTVTREKELTLGRPLVLGQNATLILTGGNLTAPAVTNRGSLLVAEGASLTADTLENDGLLQNNGKTAIGGGNSRNGGTLENGGEVAFAGGHFANTGLLENDGLLGLYAARAENTGSLESNGTLELDDSTLANAADAAMDGTGTVILGRSGRMEGPEPVEMRTEYRVRFASGEGATVAEETIVTREGKLPALPQAEREGYALDGWFTAPEGGTRVDEKTAITGSQTLYARWSPTGAPVATPTPAPTATATPAPTATPTPAPAATSTPKPTPLEMHTLHFNTMGGLPLEEVRFGLGAPVELWPYTPARAGYLFAGWYSDEALTQPVGTIVLVKDTTIYAKWTADPAASKAAAPADNGGKAVAGKGKGGSAKAAGSEGKNGAAQATSTPAPTPAPEKTGTGGGLPILPVAGGVAVLAAAAVGIVLVRRKR